MTNCVLFVSVAAAHRPLRSCSEMAAVPTAASSALDGHQRLADELRVKIDEHGDPEGRTTSAAAGRGPDGDAGQLRPYATVKERLTHVVHSYRYQVRQGRDGTTGGGGCRSPRVGHDTLPVSRWRQWPLPVDPDHGMELLHDSLVHQQYQ